VLPHGPAAVEVVNRTLFERVPLESALLDEVLARPFRFLLSIEVWEDGEERAGAVLEACAKAVAPWEHRLVADSGARQRFWSLRKSAIGLLHRVLAREGLKPIALLEDGAVPPERLPEYLPEMEALLCGLGVEAHFFGHAGNGHLHLNTPLDLRRARDLELADEILREGHRIIVGHGGVLSGEHGDGRLRTPYLRDLYGDLYDRVMAPLKRILDPGRILNPGIIVAEPGDPPWREMTRYGKGYSRHPTGTPFDGDEIHAVVDLCHGCGKCRHYCPAFAATGLEAATARSKANLLREVISGRLARSALFTPKGAEVFDLCLNCKRCLDDCPTGVDIPRIAQEARRLLKAEGEPPLADWIFKRHVGVARIGQVFGPLGERVREWPLVRAGMEHLGGIDRRSPLPVHQPRAFPIPYETAGPAPGPRVAYFPGCNAWFHDAEEGPAAIAVLEALGCRVVVPELRCCGVAQISLGYEDRVREDARENVRILAALVREGAEVVFSQPSCRLAVQADYPRLLPGPETDALRGHLHDVLGFVAGREELRAELERRAHPLEGAPVAFHQPCHARVLHEDGAARLLAQVLGPRLRVLPDNCCGLAGTFGLKKRWFDVAQAIGRPQVEAFAVSGAAEIATSCSSCQLGLGSAAGRPAHHPVFYLARALGARG
jgi:Fe-S oxidoreductase